MSSYHQIMRSYQIPGLKDISDFWDQVKADYGGDP